MTEAAPPLRDLFLGALEQPAGLRESFLRRNCADPALRAQVLELLALEPPEHFLSPPDLATDAALGTTLGPYRLEPGGEGGTGRNLARHATHGHRVEIEVVPLPPSVADDRVTAFVRTAHRMNELRHPAHVRVHEHGRLAATFWFARDHVVGHDLATELDRQRRPATDGEGTLLPHAGSRAWLLAVLGTFETVADLLRAAHAIGIAHGDLTPTRIALDGAGRSHVTGFGVAALLGRPATPALDVAAVCGLLRDALVAGDHEDAGSGRVHLPSPGERAAVRGLLHRLDPGQLSPYADTNALLEDLRRVRSGEPPAASGWSQRLGALWRGLWRRRPTRKAGDRAADQRP
ncbi:MAG: hypothetical protein KF830_08505 [Planctomycetes bacterium]|nr:hypothetical protein [Planctomycetota bacterium]